jgi:hypothetical protein
MTGPAFCVRRFALFALGLLAAGSAAADDGKAARDALAGVDARFIQAPASAGAVRYFVNGNGRTLAFSASGMESRGLAAGTKSSAPESLRYEFAGARAVEPQGVGVSGTTYHWLVGARDGWATDLRSYGAIRWTGVWDGIDATWSGDRTGLKYAFTVSPGADPKAIRFTLRGAEEARVAADGALELRVGGQWLRDERPLAFQAMAKRDVPVAVDYVLEAAGPGAWRLGFALGDYDKGRALEVDPAWSAFAGLVGGNSADQVYGVARDAGGNTLACGATASSNLPVPAGYTGYNNDFLGNAFVAKLGPAGQALFVTYFGGNAFDVCTAIAVDASGIYLAGGTSSTDFPFAGPNGTTLRRIKTTPDRDAFVTKLALDGKTLAYSAVLGGADEDQAQAIAVDATGRAYVTGYIACSVTAAAGCSSGFITSVGPSATHGGSAGVLGFDAFVARIKADGSTVDYAGYIGGNGDVEMGRGIAVTAAGEAIVVGETDSTLGLPSMAGTFRTTTSGTTDAFVAKVNASGSGLTFFTLLAGTKGATQSGIDRALGVAIDPVDNAIVVVGETDSSNFPANDAGIRLGSGPQNTPKGGMDGFIVRIASSGASVLSSTYVGGARFDSVEAVAVDGAGGLYVAGTTISDAPSTFTVAATAGLATTPFGAQDGFVAKLLQSSPGSFAYAGFVGANNGASAATSNDAMHSIAASAGGILSLGGVTSATATSFTGGGGAALAGGSLPNGVVLRVNPGANVIVATAGSPQAVLAGSAFPQALQARVQDQDGNGLANFTVTFTAPGSGASALLSPTTVVTDASGMASVAATANGVVGAYSVQANVAGLAPATFGLGNQGASSVALAASSAQVSAGSAVTFTATVTGSSPTGVVTFREGSVVVCNTVLLVAGVAQCSPVLAPLGPHTLTASYAGDAVNLASTSAGATVTVVVPPAVIGVSPANLAFGTHSIGTVSLPLVLTVQNTGGQSFTISGVQASRPEYSVTNNCSAVAVGAQCTISVTIKPSASGAQDGTLTIRHTAPGSPTTIALTATGQLSLVTHLYEAVLGRAPDDGGKAFWDSEVLRLQALGANPNEAWFAMATAFFFSPEYVARGRDDAGFVGDLYRTFFDRSPDADGLAFWVGNLQGGMPREVLLAQFMFSPEFVSFTQSLFGNVAARPEVNAVGDFYRGLLARLPDTGGFTFWVGQFRVAQCASDPVGAVYGQAEAISSGFATSGEFAARHRTNAQYVGDLYNALLRRGGDLGGVLFWVQSLDAATFTREQVRQSFAASPEFSGRVNTIVAAGCLTF